MKFSGFTKMKTPDKAFHVSEIISSLQRVLAPSVKICYQHDGNIWPFLSNREDFEKIIIYLVVNARDAMLNGGIITIGVKNETILENEYVAISIRDSGCGISAENILMVTESFFTTQEHSLGLGLAIVDALVQKMGGYVQMESALHHGTRATIYIPRYRG